MTPSEAGFNGTFLLGPPDNFFVKLLHGKRRPSSTQRSFLKQLVWWTPEDQPAELLWCNAKDEWFSLEFRPIQKP